MLEKLSGFGGAFGAMEREGLYGRYSDAGCPMVLRLAHLFR